ncbi:hypothetical protein [Tsukamurella soli]
MSYERRHGSADSNVVHLNHSLMRALLWCAVALAVLVVIIALS